MCVAGGLTLHELGVLMSRPDPAGHVPSDFEVLCMDAREHALDESAKQRIRERLAARKSPE